jgi:hypothetical protein
VRNLSRVNKLYNIKFFGSKLRSLKQQHTEELQIPRLERLKCTAADGNSLSDIEILLLVGTFPHEDEEIPMLFLKLSIEFQPFSSV